MGAWKILRKLRRARGHHEARLAAHAAALLRHAPARGRRRPARGAGDARPRRHLDDADLHARRSRVSATGASELSSAGLTSLPSDRSIASTMLLVIDNYDSFTYNLVQYLGELGADVVVRRNDAITVEEVGALAPDGDRALARPCAPAQAGVTVDVIRALGRARSRSLGVCLGHQAIGEAYGGRVVRAARAMHGKTSRIVHDGSELFAGLPSPLRGHALSLAHRRARRRCPTSLESSATAEDDPTEIHALRHSDASGVGRAVPSGVRPDARRQAAAAQLPRSGRAVRRAPRSPPLLRAVACSARRTSCCATPGPERVAADRARARRRASARGARRDRNARAAARQRVSRRPARARPADVSVEPRAGRRRRRRRRSVPAPRVRRQRTRGRHRRRRLSRPSSAGRRCGRELSRRRLFHRRRVRRGYELDVPAAASAERAAAVPAGGLLGTAACRRYDRVDGLSLPVGALVTLGESRRRAPADRDVSQPARRRRSRRRRSASRRSAAVRLDADVGRATRTNDGWIYGDLSTRPRRSRSATTRELLPRRRRRRRASSGTSSARRRSSSRSSADGTRRSARSRPWANVWSFCGPRRRRAHGAAQSARRARRRSAPALVGAALEYAARDVQARLSAEVEQSFRDARRARRRSRSSRSTARSSSRPSRTQRLRIDAHARGHRGRRDAARALRVPRPQRHAAAARAARAGRRPAALRRESLRDPDRRARAADASARRR